MAQKDDLGISACCSSNHPDYWAGAVAACGGVDKMPTVAQLAELANYLYNTDSVSSGLVCPDISTVCFHYLTYGLTLDYDKVSALGFSNFFNSGGNLAGIDYSIDITIWSGYEANACGAHAGIFSDTFYMSSEGTSYPFSRIYNPTVSAICLEGDDSPTLCEQVEENFNIKSSACDTEIDTIVTAASSGSFASATPHIVFANGLKMYIASELDEIADLADSDDDDDTTGYLIYMDVNGDSGKGVLFQDVFPFYLLKSGKVVPLYNADKDAGAATSAHLSVNAYYDTYSNGTRTVNLLLAGSDFMTAACSVGYVTSETYCGSITKSSYCSDKTADCRYKVYKPFRLF